MQTFLDIHNFKRQDNIFETKIINVTYKVEISKLMFFGYDLSQIRKNLCVPQTTLVNIQEDPHKVEQSHFLWNSSTIYGTVS